MHAPSVGSLEFVNTNSTQTPNHNRDRERDIGAARRSQVTSQTSMRTLAISPIDMMGKNTAEKWFDSNTRLFQKVEEGDDDIPFYEKIKRRKDTIDHDA